jgi:pimeloyl-ACP methyl ester carboxylesterase
MASDLEEAIKLLIEQQEEVDEGQAQRDLESGARRTIVKYEDRVIVMGHSMGGGTLMNALVRNAQENALRSSSSSASSKNLARDDPFSYVKGAVVVDVTPNPTRSPEGFATLKKYLGALHDMPLASGDINNLDQAHKWLKPSIPNDNLRNFMLTNLRFHNPKKTEKTGGYWIANVPVLKESLGPAMTFPHGPTPETYEGEKVQIPTLFVYGANSEYHTEDGLQAIPHYFDDVAGVEVIPNAGHFVHHEQKDLFVAAVEPFLKKVL